MAQFLSGADNARRELRRRQFEHAGQVLGERRDAFLQRRQIRYLTAATVRQERRDSQNQFRVVLRLALDPMIYKRWTCQTPRTRQVLLQECIKLSADLVARVEVQREQQNRRATRQLCQLWDDGPRVARQEFGGLPQNLWAELRFS